MIVSYSNQFIFIHAVNTGGTSVGEALKPVLADGDILSGYPTSHQDWHKHGWAKDVHRRLDLSRFYSFGFVRNPWDLMVANFCWWQQVDKTGWDLTHYNRLVNGRSFDEYLLNNEWMIKCQCSEYFWDGKTCLVNFVGRFETLQNDFENVCNTLGIKAKLGWYNRSSHRHYRSYYTNDKMISLVAKYFADDINRFKYSF